MIKYDPLWRTLKEKGISQYQLIKDYGIDKAQLQRLRQNLVGYYTRADLCTTTRSIKIRESDAQIRLHIFC